MPPDPLESSLTFILLQMCSDFATPWKTLQARKFRVPLLRKFLGTSLETMQLMSRKSAKLPKLLQISKDPI